MQARAPFEEFEAGKYGVIFADPAWKYITRSETRQTRAASVHYKTMSLDDIKAMPVADLAAPNSVLLLWSLNPMLPQALDVMQAWGFEFKTIAFTWAKNTKRSNPTWAPKWHFGMGYWTRQNTESVLLGVRGKPKRLSKGVRQLQFGPVREHSRKPDEIYDEVQRLLPGPYLEMNARIRRPGWDAHGDEVGKFDATSDDLAAARASKTAARKQKLLPAA